MISSDAGNVLLFIDFGLFKVVVLFVANLLFQRVDFVAENQGLLLIVEDDLTEQFPAVLICLGIAVASLL